MWGLPASVPCECSLIMRPWQINNLELASMSICWGLVDSVNLFYYLDVLSVYMKFQRKKLCNACIKKLSKRMQLICFTVCIPVTPQC